MSRVLATTIASGRPAVGSASVPRAPAGRGGDGRFGRGFTLLELILVVCLVAVLAAFFLDRAIGNFETAERLAMENQARAIGSALNLQLAALIAGGRDRDIVGLARQNPVEWLQAPPANYLGELDRPPEGGDAPGNWYFDRGSRELVYLVRRGERFVPDASGRKRVRFRVVLLYDTRPPAAGTPVGAVFRPAEAYQWGVNGGGLPATGNQGAIPVPATWRVA